MYKLILSLVCLLQFNAFADTSSYEGTSRMNTRRFSNLSELAKDGLKFRALENALDNCKEAGNNNCIFKEILQTTHRSATVITAKVDAIGSNSSIREQFNFNLTSDGWRKTIRFTALEIDGIKFSIINSSLQRCHAATNWEVCALGNVEIVNNNIDRYDPTWDENTFEVGVRASVRGVNF